MAKNESSYIEQLFFILPQCLQLHSIIEHVNGKMCNVVYTNGVDPDLSEKKSSLIKINNVHILILIYTKITYSRVDVKGFYLTVNIRLSYDPSTFPYRLSSRRLLKTYFNPDQR